jgi:long-chain acyl-CoA synthetase
VSLASILQRSRDYPHRPALVCENEPCTYAQLEERVATWRQELAARRVSRGECVALTGALSPDMVAMLLALIDNANIVIPFLSASDFQLEDALRLGCADAQFHFAADGTASYVRCGYGATHPLLERLRGEPREAGLILFTSGSTGRNKASVHLFSRLIANVVRKPGRPWRTLIFLMCDHIGGMNTLLHALLHGGTAVFPAGRSVESVCQAIERHRVELLPTTPTFLNMMLIARKFDRYDLSSLRLVTYGTEPMAASTLNALNAVLPSVQYKQTYGLTEAGILPTRSEGPGSAWMKVGGANYETRVVDGILWIRSDSVMLGYLNAPSPFDAEGWLNTGDRVEVRDGYMRILGRDSEIINVAGEKVYPAEVENLILQVENVADVMVAAKTSPVTGHVVVATVQMHAPEDPGVMERRIRHYCQERLPPYKVPVAVKVTLEPLFGTRFKKLRKAAAVTGTSNGD